MEWSWPHHLSFGPSGQLPVAIGQVVGWCFFKNFLGVDCPGCGLTHSIVALIQGKFHQSVSLHPMGIVVSLWFLNLWWWRHFELSKTGRLWISHGVLLGFLVPWIVKMTMD